MTDKRDAVIEAAKVWADNRWGVQERSNYQNWDVVDAADFALSREIELRRQIVDELTSIIDNGVDIGETQTDIEHYIEKLRGNK